MTPPDLTVCQTALKDIESRLRGLTPPIRVLLIEDDPNDVTLFCECIKGMQVMTDFAKDAESAMKIATAKAFDLFIVDIRLALGSSGISFVDWCANVHRDFLEKIIILTAFYGGSECDEALQKGVHCIVQKPIREEQIRRLFKGAKNE